MKAGLPRATGMKAPFLFALAPLVGGILIAQRTALPEKWMAAGALLLLLGGAAALAARCRAGALLALGALFFCLGAALERREQHTFIDRAKATAFLGRAVETGDALRFEGITTSLPQPDPEDDTLEATVRVRRVWTGGAVVQTDFTADLKLHAASGRKDGWKRGDRVQAFARFSFPRGFLVSGTTPSWVYWHNRGVDLLASCKSPALFGTVPDDEPRPGTALAWRAARAGRLPVFGPPIAMAGQAARRLFALPGRLRDSLDELHLAAGACLEAHAPDPRTRDILLALLLGRNVESPELRDRWVDAGLYHILVVSGFHLTLIAGFLGGALRLLRLPRPVHHLALIALLGAYVAFVQAGVSLDRAFLAISLFLVGRMFHRAAGSLNALAMAAVLLLAANPWNLRDTGFLLTFASVFALVLVATPLETAFVRPVELAGRHLFSPGGDFSEGPDSRRGRRLRFTVEGLLPFRPRGWQPGFVRGTFQSLARLWKTFWTVTLSSLAVLFCLAPVLSTLHLPVSLQGLLSTLPALLLVWPVLILLLGLPVALLAAPGSAPAIVQAAAFLGRPLDALADAFARAPLFLPAPQGWAVAAAGGLALFALLGPKRRVWAAFAVMGALAVNLAGERPAPPDGLLVELLDVGEGEAILMRTPTGQAVLLDTGGMRPLPKKDGPPTGKGDLARRVLLPALLERGVTRLDALVISHFDTDHAGSAASLIRCFPVQALYVPDAGWRNHPPLAADVFRQALASGTACRLLGAAGEEAGDPDRETPERPPPARTEQELVFGGLRLRVLHPAPEAAETRANRLSLVMEADWGGTRLLLPGDIDKKVENALVSRGQVNPVTVLKAAHHGSKSSTGARLLAAAAPRFAVISCGPPHVFSHPSDATIQAFDERGIPWWSTYRCGEIRLRFRNGGVAPSFPALWAREEEWARFGFP